MSVTVRVPSSMRQFTAGRPEVNCKGDTVRAVLEDLDSACPGIWSRLSDDSGELKKFVAVFLSNEDIRLRDGLDTPVEDGAELDIISAIAGG